MKNFNDFLMFFQKNITKVQYDTINSLREEWNEGLTLSQADIKLITKINQKNTLAVLRQYHEWLKTQQQT